jgi:hydrophobic/amphiphilic exporter-1 (mainly G- bacteria), HAE1 family
VRVRDVSVVRMGAKEREEITRVGGRESVEIAIFKEGDANTVTVARAARADRAVAARQAAPGLRADTCSSTSRVHRAGHRRGAQRRAVGGGLAILVLLFFLRDLRSTLIIGTSIPLSVIATFVLMYRLDISLNIMSLGGLTLGIGMLVDNSIVVLESIHRARPARPGSRARRDRTAPTEVGAAVVASTLTTVAVFLPIVFVEGVAGQLFRDQALTVTVSLLASLASRSP